MKTIEEKAVAYDEVIRRAKIALDCCDSASIATKNTIYNILPELKVESEDEKIRKWLIAQLKIKISDNAVLNNMIYKALSWLEKQKVLSAKEDIQGREDVLWCIKQAQKYAKDENEMGTCWFAEKWLEKQSEKPEGKSAQEAINEKKIDNQNCVNPVNKVEPKFKVGDAIRLKNSDAEYIIESISGGKYYCKGCSIDIIGCDRDYELADKKELKKIDARENLTLDGDLMAADCMIVEQKPAWSEEDERAIGIIKIALEHPYDMEGKWDRKFVLDWLKSLRSKSH